MLKVGEMAPDFCLPDQDGKEVCLKDFRGRWVVLYFYPKDNTPGCTAEAISFTEHLDEISKLNAEVIGISADTVQSHKKFEEKRQLKIRLLSDTERKVIAMYGAQGTLGTVRSTFLIDPTGKIDHVWPKVSVKGHTHDVKSVLELKVKM
ncbi:peroxiredoxin [Athalassotoga saccharophila]|uniref:peroxiredoxin n=1 Tax=Athalassotoga saccharophila TaxID=1441386 RepID=UPI0013797DDC|nr:peroxiredoxin [Athalassotoga saccharophila]BBJ28488.1 thiol peroxidase, Bcp-type [Athalassotoga saccharophila]